MELGHWVPGTIIASAAVALFKLLFSQYVRRIEKLEAGEKDNATSKEIGMVVSRLDRIEIEIRDVAVKMAGTATNEGLGRFGERLETKIANVSDRVAVLEATRKRRA